jgi:hypothetical protein
VSEAGSTERNAHDASASALGYLHQAKVALAELLRRTRRQPAINLRLEMLDDVTFEAEGTPIELLQVKHHMAAGSVSDASEDIWRTIAVWLDARDAIGPDVADVTFLLMTTSTAASGSAASMLRPEARDVEAAATRLERIASTSTNQANRSAYSRFLDLASEDRRLLLGAVVIADASPDIIDLDLVLQAELRLAAEPHAVPALTERLLGWWYQRVVRHLLDDQRTPIEGQEVQLKVDDLREQFLSDNLPIDIFPGDAELASMSADDRQFVRQLQLFAASDQLLELAIRDYKRAFLQRSRWTRDGLLKLGELDRYEQALIDEWEHHRAFVQARRQGEATEASQKAEGQELYERVQGVGLRIRDRVSEPFVTRGSYHILADQEAPPLGWHPEFVARLRALLEESA